MINLLTYFILLLLNKYWFELLVLVFRGITYIFIKYCFTFRRIKHQTIKSEAQINICLAENLEEQKKSSIPPSVAQKKNRFDDFHRFSCFHFTERKNIHSFEIRVPHLRFHGTMEIDENHQIDFFSGLLRLV